MRASVIKCAVCSGIALAAICCVVVLNQWRARTASPASPDVIGLMNVSKYACRTDLLQFVPARVIPNAVEEDDLITALSGALPWWSPPTVPAAFHELKLWGRRATFTKEVAGAARTGEWLVEALLSDALCQQRLFGEHGTYLLDSPFGIRVVLMGTEDSTRYRAQAHYGQLLKILGEVGVPSTKCVTTASGRNGAVEDILRDEIMHFADSGEVEFMATALAYWLPPRRQWTNRFGQEFDFSSLTLELMEAPLGKGSCGGCHVPYAIVCLLRADDQHKILDQKVRARATEWLRRLLLQLEKSCAEHGGWDREWAAGASQRFMWGDDLLDRITVTGHHLEWIAMLPADVEVDEEVVRRAVRGLRADIESLPPISRRSFKTILPVSHAARALALLTGNEPFAIWNTYWEGGRLTRHEKGYSVRQANSGPLPGRKP